MEKTCEGMKNYFSVKNYQIFCSVSLDLKNTKRGQGRERERMNYLFLSLKQKS